MYWINRPDLVKVYKSWRSYGGRRRMRMEVYGALGKRPMPWRDLFMTAGIVLFLITGCVLLLSVWIHPWGKGGEEMFVWREPGFLELVESGKSPSVAIDEFLKGRDINMVDDGGRTLLMDAASHCDGSVVKAILDRDAEVNAVDKQGMTALMLAVLHGKNREVIESLAQAGADLNAPDSSGWTPLHQAVMGYGKSKDDEPGCGLNEIKLLIQLGADVNAVNQAFGFNMRPLDCLYFRKDSEWRESDLEKGKELVQIFLNSGASILPPEKCSRTIVDNVESISGEKKLLEAWKHYLLDCGFEQAEK